MHNWGFEIGQAYIWH